MLDGLFSVMEELEIKNIIIGKQFQDSENYQKFIKIINEKKIEVYVVEAGERISIEKNVYFDVLWPNTDNIITDNSINNNSLVCKLIYYNFSMLFTGDIEKIAEEKILRKVNNIMLNADILKIAHHGSKTSSLKEFIEVVKPKIALIGVGKNNKFGHPNSEVIDRLMNFNVKIYRTDEEGEIRITIDSKGKVKVY